MRSAGVIGFFFSSMPVGGTMAWATWYAEFVGTTGVAAAAGAKQIANPSIVRAPRMPNIPIKRAARSREAALFALDTVQP
jgi:hypothetical protein